MLGIGNTSIRIGNTSIGNRQHYVLVLPILCIGVAYSLNWCCLFPVFVLPIFCIDVSYSPYWCCLFPVLVLPILCIGVTYSLHWCCSVVACSVLGWG